MFAMDILGMEIIQFKVYIKCASATIIPVTLYRESSI